MNVEHGSLTGMRVLITGGTGFVGGRLVERLVMEQHANVRVMVRNYTNATRIARFPIEMIKGDITNKDDVFQAAKDCKIIFHLAYGNDGSEENRRRVNVGGTKNIIEATLYNKVDRLIYLSTVMVYGKKHEEEIDETYPRRYSGNHYADTKLDAENLVLESIKMHGLRASVIQPTTVYGPFAPVWTVNVLNQLKTGNIILVNDGDGICNAVYIDDLINAMILVATKDQAIAEVFLISGAIPVTWKTFFKRYEQMLGISSTINMTASEAILRYKERQKLKGFIHEMYDILREENDIRNRIINTYELHTLRKLMRLLVPDQIKHSIKRKINGGSREPGISSDQVKPILLLHPSGVQFYTKKTKVCINKAKSLIGYQPCYDFEAGMHLTEQWAKWANLLN
ncbi:3 beta-hydroxysteroid dehydrogenase/Delta 5--_4-isomerase [bacterium BMS3Abin07]|nr:3 beta-hydroxysteroid dehydrogenase/Delta 5-->4-isomerase [bacterium BMS3Abin07]